MLLQTQSEAEEQQERTLQIKHPQTRNNAEQNVARSRTHLRPEAIQFKMKMYQTTIRDATDPSDEGI